MMIRILLPCFFCQIILTNSITAFAQEFTPNEIIKKCYQAHGGLQNWSRVESMITKYTWATFTTFERSRDPNLSYSVREVWSFKKRASANTVMENNIYIDKLKGDSSSIRFNGVILEANMGAGPITLENDSASEKRNHRFTEITFLATADTLIYRGRKPIMPGKIDSLCYYFELFSNKTKSVVFINCRSFLIQGTADILERSVNIYSEYQNIGLGLLKPMRTTNYSGGRKASELKYELHLLNPILDPSLFYSWSRDAFLIKSRLPSQLR